MLVCNAPTGSVFRYVPAAVALTLTVTEQLPFAGMLRPPGNVTVLPFAVAITVEPPPQVVLALGIGAIRTPVGSVSTSAMVVVATVAFALVSTMVRVETPPALMLVGLNDLPSAVVVAASTVSGAVDDGMTTLCDGM